MRVLLQGRLDLREKPGGDAVHVESLARLLPKFGIRAEVATSANPDVQEVAVLHLFNIGRVEETYAQWLNASKQGVPTVCTPIYSQRRRLERYELEGWYGWYRQLPRFVPDFERRQELKTLLRCLSVGRPMLWARQWSMGYRAQQLAVLQGVRKVLVDTKVEAEAIATDFGLSDLPVDVLPLGADAALPENPAGAILPSGPLEPGYVFCPARVEPLKNQLTLLQALQKTNLEVVFAGHLSGQHRSYARRFLTAVEGNPKWRYLGYVSGETLASVYAGAAVVAIPSWVENCCLAAVEGAAHGKPVVVTSESYTHEYLSDRAHYCDPASTKSIHDAIVAALERGTPRTAPIPAFPTWKDHARSTVRVYEECIAGTAERAGSG